ncbi:MAG: oxidoreductase [Candidatus Kapabacteria bacterium]|nr:oxidoreductase [Candidatus Kapabacteria bacterium]
MEVLVLGSTGLVGTALTSMLRSDPAFGTIRTPGRAELSAPYPHDWKPDVIMCCLGTTIKRAGSQAAFEEVDRHIPVRIARAMYERGCRHCIVVSAIASDINSRIFYSRVKGAMEADLRSIGFTSLTIVRPSLLLGHRREFRLGERLSMLIMVPLARLIPARWRGVRDTDVAAAMIADALHPVPGIRFIENAEMVG